MTEYEIEFFLYKLLNTLDELHARGIMCCDVKPRNVLITRLCRKSKKNDRYIMKLQEDDDRSLMLVDLGPA